MKCRLLLCVLSSVITLSLGAPLGFNPMDMFQKVKNTMEQVMGGANNPFTEIIQKAQQAISQIQPTAMEHIQKAISQVQQPTSDMQNAFSQATQLFEQMTQNKMPVEQFMEKFEEMKGMMGGADNPVVQAFQQGINSMQTMSQQTILQFQKGIEQAIAQGGQHVDKFKDLQKNFQQLMEQNAPLEKFMELMESSKQFGG